MERLNGIKGAIFDLDGTLFDSLGIWEDIDRLYFARHGAEMPADYVEKVNAMSFEEAAAYTAEHCGITESPAEIMREWRKMCEYAYAHDITLKPNAEKYLRALKSRGVKLAVATALNKVNYTAALKNNGIYNMFDAYADLSEVSRGKGFPDVYLLAAERLELPPSDCAVYEDLRAGITGAAAGGFVTVGVYDSYSAADTADIIKIADYYFAEYPG